MSAPILATKLFIPPRRPMVVPRPHLLTRLDDGLHRKLTLVCAPAGFGKTTLISEWAAELQKTHTTELAWLSLDARDADPLRFLTYLITALQTRAGEANTVPFGANLLAMLQSAQPPSLEPLLTNLLNEIATIPLKIVLVLDDYHEAESPAVDETLTFLLDHLMPQNGMHDQPSQGLHLVIISRMDPAMPLSRLRAGDQMTEVREADLRFTPAESAAFLNETIGLTLAADDVAALAARTEGWVAGLQLAALSMQGLSGETEIADFVQRFTGSDRYIHDYLTDEVLQQCPPDTQRFLLQTSILERLSASLCDAVTQRADSEAILATLEAANLFFVPLDDERRWYRYHHLFADLLRQRLQHDSPAMLPTLHQRAAAWYAAAGFTDAAIEHAVQAEDFATAARQIESLADQTWASGSDSRLARWLAQLPLDSLVARPRLTIYRAWYLLANGAQTEADELIARTTALLGEDSARLICDEAERTLFAGRLAVCCAFSAFYRGDAAGIIQHANRALTLLPFDEAAWRGPAAHLLGDGYDFAGQMEQAYRARLYHGAGEHTPGGLFQQLIANLKLAVTVRHLAQPTETQSLCAEQYRLVQQAGLDESALAGWLLAIWGEACAENGDLDDALAKAARGVALTERGGDLAMRGWSCICLTRVLFSRGDYADAANVVETLAQLAEDAFVPPWILHAGSAWRARLLLAQGRTEAAVRWAQQHDLRAQDRLDYNRESEHIALARILMAGARHEEAAQLLARLLHATRAGGRTARTIELLILSALLAAKRSDDEAATDALCAALRLAEPGGLIRAFVDEGAACAALLAALPAATPHASYVQRLLAAFPPVAVDAADGSGTLTSLIEPLSNREQEVLSLVAQGMSNAEISDRLFLSLHTVKGHNRNIFGKLGVRRRTEAVARARALGLL